MKKNLTTIVSGILIGTVLITSCKKEGCTDDSILVTNYDPDAKKDDGSCVARYSLKSGEVLVTSNISSNVTWTNDKVYVLPKRIAVTNGATLTINPGTVIKGIPGTGQNASALLIAQGSKINAVGTANQPIIFTSTEDEITSGEIISPNLSPSTNGKWGGLIILGKAPISADAATMQIEGIPASDENGVYGGTDAMDNSGVIKYVSVRHGGANIGDGNEINGITFGGVGAGTIVENIEVVGNQDDGVEFFGGTVNVDNLIVWSVGDDAVDGDQAWAGTLNNFIVVMGDDSDHALELDGPEGAADSTMTLMNGTIKGNDNGELGQLRDGARVVLKEIYFYNFNDTTSGRGDFGFDAKASEDNYVNGITQLSNLEITVGNSVTWTLDKIFKDGTDAAATEVTTPTVGADKTPFNKWSWTEASVTDLPSI